jgi:hypothetical protein
VKSFHLIADSITANVQHSNWLLSENQQTGINPTNLFSSKNEDFFHFLSLRLSVCSLRKYCPYFKIAKHSTENWKNEEIKVW